MLGLSMTKYHYDIYAYEKRYNRVYETGAPFWEEPIPTSALVNFLRKLNPPKGLRAIDMGCGEGRDSVCLSKFGFDVTSIDASRSGLKRAKEYAKTKKVSIGFLAADVMNLPVRDEIYDLAINIACLQMLIHQDIRDKHLHEVHRVLSHEGTFFSCNVGVDKSVSVEDFYKNLGKEPGNQILRKIKIGTEEKEIFLPIIAAWPKAKEQYLEEFERAGFSNVKAYKENVTPVGDCWILIARKR